MSGFLSNFTRRLDAKGRVSIPASFRACLITDGHQGVFCYPSLDMRAVDAGGHALLGQIEKRLSGLPVYSEEHDFLSTAFYGMSQILSIDGEGRVVLSDEIKSFAHIEDELVLVGQGYKFQIWHPDAFADHMKEARARALEARKRLSLQISSDQG